jgi:hypothetical protein
MLCNKKPGTLAATVADIFLDQWDQKEGKQLKSAKIV